MSIDISPQIQNRLAAWAHAEGMSIDALLERLIDEHEELAAIVHGVASEFAPLSQKEIQAKVERGFLESEGGDTTDGDSFTTRLLRELDEMERHTGSCKPDSTG